MYPSNTKSIEPFNEAKIKLNDNDNECSPIQCTNKFSFDYDTYIHTYAYQHTANIPQGKPGPEKSLDRTQNYIMQGVPGIPPALPTMNLRGPPLPQ